jgi:hypothetical protein
MVNIYGEKENIDKEYGREGIRWVGVSNEKVDESNSRKCTMASHCSLRKIASVEPEQRKKEGMYEET